MAFWFGLSDRAARCDLTTEQWRYAKANGGLYLFKFEILCLAGFEQSPAELSDGFSVHLLGLRCGPVLVMQLCEGTHCEMRCDRLSNCRFRKRPVSDGLCHQMQMNCYGGPILTVKEAGLCDLDSSDAPTKLN